MRLTRTPVRTAYRPTPIPPPVPVGSAGPTATDDWMSANTQPGDRSTVKPAGSAGISILPIIIACLFILCMTAIGLISLARTHDLSPMAITKMIPAFFHTPRVSPEKPVPVATATEQPPQRRILTSRAWSLWKNVSPTLDPLDPTVAAPQSFQTSRTFPPGFDIIEGGTIQSEQTRIRLGWIASMPANAVCLSDQSTKFACGLMARASLSIMASGEKLVCYPDVSLATENPLFLCQSRGRDLSLAQVGAGFALPAQPDIEGLVRLEDVARTAHAGAWNGDWTIIPPGGAAVSPNGLAQ